MTTQKGLIINKTHVVKFANIKGTTLTKYPLRKTGTLQINVAGEHLQQSGNNQIPVSNTVSLRYIDNIYRISDTFEEFLFLRKIPKDKPTVKAKPMIQNSLVPALLFIISIPFIPLIVWKVKRTSYELQHHRLIKQWGIVYRSQQSILYKQIDTIGIDEGALNKIFKNGNISISTAGSSTTELTVANIPKHKPFYQEIKRRYR